LEIYEMCVIIFSKGTDITSIRNFTTQFVNVK
jgi:hypothetical protein